MASPLPPIPEGRTAAGCLAGIGCAALAAAVVYGLIGLAAAKYLGLW